MKKKLRSFIHENLPFDLRVEIELLSRRRDIFNAEKQEELIKLLRKYDIPGIVPLGSGTNRYAFKLKGFVVKVATDNDGKIDNFKEFKMAKRLYPHVAKTYEVSDNGTLLIAEYIEPFQSYGDMLAYADKIREILKKLSSVYLIGDVGITKKNYANWGRRIGSDEPVCLDFAYVYDVKSELFLCKNCKNNSILIPNNDFTKLICPAVGCGKEYEFEEIRARLGNDIHNHEIGNLSDEGYILYESNVETELDESRSNYLAKPKVKKVETKKQEEVIPDNFVFDPGTINNQDTIKQGGNDQMGKLLGRDDLVVIKGVSTLAEDTPIDDNIPVIHGTSVVFTGNIDSNYGDKFEDVLHGTSEIIPQENETAEVMQMPSSEPVFSGKIDNAGSMDATPFDSYEAAIEAVEEDKKRHNEEYSDESSSVDTEVISAKVVTQDIKEEPMFKDEFLRNAYAAPLELGKKISNGYLYSIQLFEDLRTSIMINKKGKLFPEQFYNKMAYIINHALISFCNYKVEEGVNGRGKPCKHYYAPDKLEGQPYTPTLLFLQRFYLDNDLRNFDQSNMNYYMDVYMSKYNDALGMQPGIKDEIIRLLRENYSISDIGVQRILDALNEFISSDLKENLDKEIETNPVEDATEDDVRKALYEAANVGREEQEVNSNNESNVVEETSSNEVAFSGEIGNDDNDDESGEDDYYEDYQFTSVYLYPEEKLDVINVISPGAFGTLQIPIYLNLDEVNSNECSQSQSYDANAQWDWLTHLNPDNTFRTTNPDKFLDLNEINYDDATVRFAVLDETEQGDFIVGMYLIDKIVEVDEEFNYIDIIADDDKMVKINNAIVDNIGISAVSHLEMTLSSPDLIYSEEDFINRYKDLFDELFKDDDEDTTNEEVAEPVSDDENEQAALDALFGSNDMNQEEPKTFKPVHRMKSED